MVRCKDCMYTSSSNEGRSMCGLGMKVINKQCSGYEVGVPASEVVPPYHYAPHCFLPVHYSPVHDSSKHRRRIVLPTPRAWGERTPHSVKLVYRMGWYIHKRYQLTMDMVKGCMYDRDASGNTYSRATLPYYYTRGVPVPNDHMRSVFVDTYAVSPYRLYLDLELYHYQGPGGHNPSYSHQWDDTYNCEDANGRVVRANCKLTYDLPPHYWWLDITASPTDLIPMHHLIMAADKACAGEVWGYKVKGFILRLALSTGLQLRGRPHHEWVAGLVELMQLVAKHGVLSYSWEGSKPVQLRKGFGKALLREWCMLNAREGYGDL